MSHLEEAITERNKEWKDLEQTITQLIQQYYRLMGLVAYEPVDEELEEMLNNSSAHAASQN